MKRIIFGSVLFLASFSVFFLNTSPAEAATLYYYPTVDDNWNTLGNWYTDSTLTTNAGSLPGVADDVIIEDNGLVHNSGPTPSVNTMVVKGAAGVGYSGDTIIVANGATFYGGSGLCGTLQGNAVFNDTSGVRYFECTPSTITGNATFNDYSTNPGVVSGNAIFNDASKNLRTATAGTGRVLGNASFFDASVNTAGAVVSGTACFATTATNSGTVTGGTSVCASSAPTVSTGSYVSVTNTTVALLGSVDSTGGKAFTERGFEYGPTTSYGSTTSDSGTFNSENFYEVISSLTCETTYHYRAFGTTAVGTDYGDDDTFTTDSCTDSGQILYGADGLGGNIANLYTLDPATGDILTTIGSTGYGITGLAFDPTDSILYGTTGGSDATHPKSLFTINTTTGAATWLGLIKNGGGTQVGPMPDIGFSSDGTLYGGRGGNGNLYTIDPTSCNGTSDTNCLATQVSSQDVIYNGFGTAIDSEDNLYLFGTTPGIGNNFNFTPNYYIELDKDTGKVVDMPSFSNPPTDDNDWHISAAKFNASDVLYLAHTNYGDAPAELAILDLDTNTIISLGENSDMEDMDAIAWYIPPIDPPTVSTSPATSISRVGATLVGNITDTGGADATVRGFNHGLTDSYGSTLSSSGTFGTGAFSLSYVSFDCGTTYHYRAFATNTAGTSYGSDATFETLNCLSSGGNSSGGKKSTSPPPVLPPVLDTICPEGHLFSAATGLPCTLWTPLPVPTCTITTTLRLWSRGEEVKCLQTILTGLTVDGIFGPLTRVAVINFQRLHNLVPDGIVGPLTRGALSL